MSSDPWWDGRYERRKYVGEWARVICSVTGLPFVLVYLIALGLGGTIPWYLPLAGFLGGIDAFIGCCLWLRGELPPWLGNCTARQVDDDIAAVLRGNFLPADLSRMALRTDLLNKKFRLEWLIKWMDRQDRCHAEFEIERINLEMVERDHARQSENTQSPAFNESQLMRELQAAQAESAASRREHDLRHLHNLDTLLLCRMLTGLRGLQTHHAEPVAELIRTKLDERKPNLSHSGVPYYPVEEMTVQGLRNAAFAHIVLYHRPPRELLLNHHDMNAFMTLARTATPVGEYITQPNLEDITFLGMRCGTTSKASYVCCPPDSMPEPVPEEQVRSPHLRRFDI